MGTGALSSGVNRPVRKADHFHLVPMLKLRGAIPPLPVRILGVVLSSVIDRAVAEAVRHWLPTAAARVRVRAACGICGGQSGTRAGFLRVLRFPLLIIPPIPPSS
jgi:hypothetical protein